MATNLSNSSKVDDSTNTEFSKISLLIAIANLLVGIAAIVGNFLLCIAIYKDPYRRLRNTASYLVVNLAVADLLTGLITESFYTAHEMLNFMGNEEDVLYTVGETTAYVFVNASVFSLISLAWDRYIAVSYPLIYGQKTNSKRIRRVIVLIWTYSVAFSFLRFLGVPQDIFYWIDLQVNYSLAGGILIGLYVSIYLTIKRQMGKSLRAQGYNSETRRQQSVEDSHAKQKAEKKMTRTVFLLVVTAIACMLPLYVMLHVELLCESCMEVQTVRAISKLSEPVLFLNSALNPFLYAWNIPKYRQALQEVVRSWCLRLRSDSKQLTASQSSSSSYNINKHMMIINQNGAHGDFDDPVPIQLADISVGVGSTVFLKSFFCKNEEVECQGHVNKGLHFHTRHS